MDKFLIVTNTTQNDPFLLEWQKNGFQTAIIFKPCCKLMRMVRRIWIQCGLPCQSIWYGEIKKKIHGADIIIVHMSTLTLKLCQYINKQNPKAEVIAWWWNKIDDHTKPSLQKGNYEAWSFDPNDCERYDIKFNHQYYFKSFILPSQELSWDVYFCGSDSGRGEEIVRFYYILKNMGLHVNFQVVFPKSQQIPSAIVSDYVNYNEIRQNISRAGAILEIVREGQYGSTLRLMEAIYFQKKLITNNAAVKNELFYDEHRIFLYTERSIDELKDFLEEDFIPYENELIEKYDVSKWAKNFTGDE